MLKWKRVNFLTDSVFKHNTMKLVLPYVDEFYMILPHFVWQSLNDQVIGFNTDDSE